MVSLIPGARAQCRVHDLPDAEADILLHGSVMMDLERVAQRGDDFRYWRLSERE